MRMVSNQLVAGVKASALFFRGARVAPLQPAVTAPGPSAPDQRTRKKKQKAARKISVVPLSASKLAMIYNPPRIRHWGPDAPASSLLVSRSHFKGPIAFAHRRLSISAIRCFVCNSPAMPGESCCYGCKSD